MGVLIIAEPSRRHHLKSGSRHDKCSALGRTVVCAPALRSVQAYDVRRSGARQKVRCLPTRMMSVVLDREVS
jgi:hypothetical protein